jgi:hypothetical protein
VLTEPDILRRGRCARPLRGVTLDEEGWVLFDLVEVGRCGDGVGCTGGVDRGTVAFGKLDGFEIRRSGGIFVQNDAPFEGK